ncbi:MAG: PQQ-dependent sugar dehydrogenase, partial [Bacteroidetes bacterium]|nr:PQQ-dependent sugar dehydrogenase [Bacteroidota bacterium]
LSLENAFPNLSFNRPVDLQHAGDGSDRIFVVEQAGRIFVFDNDRDITSAEIFLDIRDRVNDGGNEEGLLGLAFHPTFSDNGFFYLNYTAAGPRRTVIARYSVSSTNPQKAEANSELVLLTIPQPFSNHNGGQLAFGPDNFLYIATGDGGSGGDPQNNAQNRATLLGNILRIDVDNTSGDKPYAIPSDNPFVGNSEGWAEEIFAWGLRNPWRFSFDPATNRIWNADVGQNRFEEINIIESGKNYGWRIMEGFACFNPSSGCDQTGLTIPVFEYGHDQGQSVTGGHVYRASSVPEIEGKYIYADFVSGRIWALSYNGQDDVDNELLLNSNRNIASFGVDQHQELYLCAFDGTIYRFKPTVSSTNSFPSSANTTELSDAFPNPAITGVHDRISVQFSIPTQNMVRLALFDTLGREVLIIHEAMHDPGVHRISMDITGLPAGLYLYAMDTAGMRLTKKLVIIE